MNVNTHQDFHGDDGTRRYVLTGVGLSIKIIYKDKNITIVFVHYKWFLKLCHVKFLGVIFTFHHIIHKIIKQKIRLPFQQVFRCWHPLGWNKQQTLPLIYFGIHWFLAGLAMMSFCIHQINYLQTENVLWRNQLLLTST